ncbi:hypothetical protein ScPMuIL_006686 [Solemya velum]
MVISMKRIAVIGAGCSGLVAMKSCLDQGLEPICFEREKDIGGLWNYSEEVKLSKGSVYNSCTINTCKEMMSFSDFPPPVEFPPFMPHRCVLKYFKMYAANFDLYRHIRFQTSVEQIQQSIDYQTTGRWDVRVRSEVDGSVLTETFDGVMVCTGHHSYPHIPDFPGMDKFKGKVIHSHSYRKNDEFKDKNILIVGIGNSAVDIAIDTSHVASQVCLSTRRGAWVVSRRGPWGLPADAIANSRFMFKLPKSMLQWSVEKISNYVFDHESYGLKPAHRALEAHPTISDDLPTSIMTGKVRVKPNVLEFDENGVKFEDGSYEEIDAVIFATGYDYKISFVDESVTGLKNNQPNLFKYVFPPHLPHATFAVIGLVQAIGALLPISEMQCRWYTSIFSNKTKLPTEDEMLSDIEEKRDEMRSYYHSQRHTIQAFWIEYMDEIASMIGVKPNLIQLFKEDPSLAVKCFFGPCVPSQYRLVGPGKWNGAKPTIVSAMDRLMNPMKTRILPKNRQISHNKSRQIMISGPAFLRSYFIVIYLFIVLILCMCMA